LDAFITISEKLGYNFELLKAVRDINETQKDFFLEKIKEKLWILKDKTIGILGLSFKPDTDDIRNAPSIAIIEALKAEGAKIKAYDPCCMAKINKEVRKGLKFCKDAYEACRGSDCLLIVTEWDEFKELDFAKVKKLLKRPLIIDGRNVYDPQVMKKSGFNYIGIGRGKHE
jgi:UDPglucose 6-dehydrogenase